MATYKVYKKGNYIIVEDSANKYWEEIALNTKISKEFVDSTSYTITFKDVKETWTMPFADIKKADGTAYADVATWEIFYTANTGFNAATSESVAAVVTSLSGKQDVLVSGDSIKTINGTSLLGSGNLVIAGGGGSGVTNLTYTPSPTNGIVVSDSGTDATILAADATNAGLMLAAEKTKLAIALVAVGVDYRGAYNNGDGTYGIGSVVLYNNYLYEKISNPGNPGYPPSGADWQLFEPLIVSPAYDLWIDNILQNKVNTVAGKGLSTEDYTTAEQTKLAGIAAGATANDTDANLKARANHTGTQSASTISDIQSTITNNTQVLANTAKISFDSTSSTRLANTSGTNTGDNAVNSLYSGLAASKQNAITLTTTGYEGVATLSGSTLNIPAYKSVLYSGNFAGGEAYNAGDVVLYNNSLYYCILSIGSASAPSGDATHWSLFLPGSSTITLTTTGTSGAATLVGTTLNVPQYTATVPQSITNSSLIFYSNNC